jgi:predicted nuclease with TOPRIM domain
MSDPIRIPNSKKIKDPHLVTWDCSLSQRITEKEHLLEKLKKEMKNTFEEKEKQILFLETIQKNQKEIINKVKKTIQYFFSEIKEKIHSIKETDSTEIFEIYKSIYQTITTFFSKKEFSFVPSTLKEQQNLNKIQIPFFQDQEHEDSWMEWLVPIWNMEEIYNDLSEKYDENKKKLQEINDNYCFLTGEKNQQTKEIELLKKERRTLKEFSDKLIECRKISS